MSSSPALMTVLVVGSVALDSVETPFGKADLVLGGSGTFFSAAASHLSPVQLVGVVGNDYPMDKLRAAFKSRPIDLAGLEQADGASFRWRGRYRHDLNTAETLETHLGVFSNFRPKIPEQFRRAPFVFLGNIDPRLQLDVLTQVERPKLVACDTMNFWIESRRPDLLKLMKRVDAITLNDAEARQLTDKYNVVRAARWMRRLGRVGNSPPTSPPARMRRGRSRCSWAGMCWRAGSTVTTPRMARPPRAN